MCFYVLVFMKKEEKKIILFYALVHSNSMEYKIQTEKEKTNDTKWEKKKMMKETETKFFKLPEAISIQANERK